jgi:predicted Zn-dependent protease
MVIWAAATIVFFVPRMSDTNPIRERFAELARTGGFSPADLEQIIESYSKQFELEADALGTVLTARAGFDPLKGAEFFFRIPEPGNGFLSTHPPNEARLAVVQEVAATIGGFPP